MSVTHALDSLSLTCARVTAQRRAANANMYPHQGYCEARTMNRTVSKFVTACIGHVVISRVRASRLRHVAYKRLRVGECSARCKEHQVACARTDTFDEDKRITMARNGVRRRLVLASLREWLF